MSSVSPIESSLQGSEKAFTKIQNWLCVYVGKILSMSPEDVDPDEKFDRHGLDSSAVVGLVGDLSVWTGCELDPALTYDFPTISAVARELASREQIVRVIAH